MEEHLSNKEMRYNQDSIRIMKMLVFTCILPPGNLIKKNRRIAKSLSYLNKIKSYNYNYTFRLLGSHY